jgi:hypothetical protein
MKRKNIIRVFFTLLILIQSSFAFAQEKMDESKIREEQAYTLGTSAYTWGFTMTEIYRVRDMQIKAFGAVNTFSHIRGLADPEATRAGGVVSANNATVYSQAWLDLSLEPIVVDVPPIPDRYYTINYIDFYQKCENISNLTEGSSGGSYAFTAPGWEGSLPDGVKRISVATNDLWIIGRTEVKGPEDLAAANAVQDKYALTALSEWQKGNRNSMGDNSYDEWPAYDVSNPINWYAMLNECLRRNPPYGPDAEVSACSNRSALVLTRTSISPISTLRLLPA